MSSLQSELVAHCTVNISAEAKKEQSRNIAGKAIKAARIFGFTSFFVFFKRAPTHNLKYEVTLSTVPVRGGWRTH